jgi:hypothetical protein
MNPLASTLLQPRDLSFSAAASIMDSSPQFSELQIWTFSSNAPVL